MARQDVRSPRRRGVNHAALLQLVRAYLQCIPGCYVRKIAGGMGQLPMSDLVCCIAGRYVGVELKTGTAVLSEGQRRDRDEVRAAGGVWLEVRSVDELEEALLAAGLLARRLLA